MKILVIQQKMIGDVLAGTVICQAIKIKHPAAEVHYMIHPNTLAVVENNPSIDQIVIFDPKENKGFSALVSFGKKLKKENYDVVIDAYGKWESIIPAFYSGAKTSIGFRKWYTSFFYTKTVIPKKNVSGSAIYHRLQLAEAFTQEFIESGFPKIYLSENEISEAKRNLSEISANNTKIIMISVLGSSENKSLPASQMAETLDIIAKFENVKLLFNFMPNQQNEAKAIFELCRPETRQKIVFEFYMKGLRPFLSVLSQCDALIGNEGGAVNMAKALGIPTFTIFSPWINKASWDMLTHEDSHAAVHLQDYFPEVYGSEHSKKFRENALEMYTKLTTDLYRERLEQFVKKVIS